MSIRKHAISWLTIHVGSVDSRQIITSKFYIPSQSATKRNAWWIQIPLDRIVSREFMHFYLVCQSAPGSENLHVLKVPREYLEQNLSRFAMIGNDKINLFLSAEQNNLFQDERGPGNVRFASFVAPV